MILPLLLILAALCSAQDVNSSARELARKIGRQDIATLTIRNASSLPDLDAAEVRKTIESELRSRLQKPEGATVKVTLSENLQGYLWVAEIQRGDERDVVMLNVVRPEANVSSQAAVAIEKKLVWEQDGPILDIARVGMVMAVLEPGSVALYRERQFLSLLPISGGPPAPRDPRGRLLALDEGSFQAFLPGLACKGALAPAPSMTCAGNSGGVVAGKNYFTEPSLPPFFSIATLSDTTRVIAGVDGRAHVYEGAREVGSFTGWGSDITAVESGCRAGRQVLASRPGEAGEADAVQAYEVVDGRATPAGDPVTFSGLVTALWSAGQLAMAVARNSETGRYAAYSLAITCSR